MTERLDVLAVREYEQNGEKKTAWCRVGVYFLERKRAAEKKRRDQLQAAGDRREAERLRRWRAEQTVARAVERSVAAARRRLEERGIVVKVAP